MKRIIFTFLFLLGLGGVQQIMAQIDTEFWFAAPELTEGIAGAPLRDRPIYMVLSSFDQPTEVEILQPANLGGFETIEVEIDPYSTQEVNLTERLAEVESKPANEVLTTGMLVRASQPINAYYEIRSPNNTDLLSLKGKNALGEKFYLPFQTQWANDQSLNDLPYLPPPRSGFVVMATDDSTTVEITPKVDLLGHPANFTFEVFLQRGETYYCEAADSLGMDRPAGTLVVADKPITVTTKDDMIDNDFNTDGGADVAADQMISLEWTGTEHIVMNSNLAPPGDQAYLLATASNTDIYLNGSTTPEITLNQGEQYYFGLDEDAYFIESSKPIYVWQIGGIGDQIAGAAIPALECTGSKRVSFIRSSSNTLFLNLTIRSGSEGNFTLNGDPTAIEASDFSPVPGSDGDYVYARLQLPTSALSAGETGVVENTGDELFHMGITNRSNGQSANFGYFTNFSYLNIGGSSTDICLNDSLVLDAGPGKTDYGWNTGDTTQRITVTQPGTYIVETYSGSDCYATDTINVNYYEPPIDLGEDQTICEGDSLVLDPGGSYFYTWQDSSEESTFTVDTAGIYSVQVTDFQGCTTADSIEIFTSPRPQTPEITGDTVICAGGQTTLSVSTISGLPDAGYRWQLPDGQVTGPGNALTIQNAAQADSGYYYASYLVDGCQGYADSVRLEVNPVPEVELGDDQQLCDDSNYLIDPEGTTGLDHLWSDGSTDTTLSVTQTGSYDLQVTNTLGCSSADSVQIVLTTTPDEPEITGNTEYCDYDTLMLNTQQTSGVDYDWFNSSDEPQEANNGLFINDSLYEDFSGTYYALANIGNCYSDTMFFEVTVYSVVPAIIEGDSIICREETTLLSTPVTNYDSYAWSTGDSTNTVEVSEAGSYTLEASMNGCVSADTFDLEVSEPMVDFTREPEGEVTPGEPVTFEGSAAGNATPIDTWLWEVQDNGEYTGNPVEVLFSAPGYYDVTLTATDASGCQATNGREETIAYPLAVPTVFSPNGDGKNDRFVIQGLELYDNVSLKIFNRWGEAVFKDANYRNFWDAHGVTDGTYFYTLHVGGQAKNGTITIIR